MHRLDAALCLHSGHGSGDEQTASGSGYAEEEPRARRLYVALAEDMIMIRLAWYAAGNRTSGRQWADIQGMLHVQRDLLDHTYLAQCAPALHRCAQFRVIEQATASG